MRSSAASLASEYSPRQAGVIRPSGVTAVISTITIPAPDNDSEHKCCRCQSFAEPSTALYWHIGDTAMRLARTRPPMVIGENSCASIRDPTTDLRVIGSSSGGRRSSVNAHIDPRRFAGFKARLSSRALSQRIATCLTLAGGATQMTLVL
jgi:hypothetical protein